MGGGGFENLVAEEEGGGGGGIAGGEGGGGAHIVDVCMQSTERDEKKDIPPFYEKLIRKVKAPVMIDTTDPTAIELALTYCQGKAILNSINLEDGEEKFERVVPIAHEFGAAVVVGCIDEEKLRAQEFTRERELAENLLFSHPPKDVPADHSNAALLRDVPADWRKQSKEQRAAVNQHYIAAIAEHFRTAKKKEKARAADLPLDERLANYIIEGTRDGLIADLEKKRGEGTPPLDIVNGPLMAGMAEVGRLFNANELIVAEVLQSAEAMKAAVSHLEQFMEKADTAKRGKVVLATVKGDVHDIGKNLVEIILKNNGYDVVNLGIKVPPEELIKAYLEHKPDTIGLSGLLVKSAQQMVITANDLKDAGIEIPMLVGGAALSAKFTQTKIAPSYGKAVCYAKDAMTGVRLMNELMDPATRETVVRNHTFSGNGFGVTTTVSVAEIQKITLSPKVRAALPIRSWNYLDRKVRLVPDLREVWGYINPFMLFGRHM